MSKKRCLESEKTFCEEANTSRSTKRSRDFTNTTGYVKQFFSKKNQSIKSKEKLLHTTKNASECVRPKIKDSTLESTIIKTGPRVLQHEVEAHNITRNSSGFEYRKLTPKDNFIFEGPNNYGTANKPKFEGITEQANVVSISHSSASLINRDKSLINTSLSNKSNAKDYLDRRHMEAQEKLRMLSRIEKSKELMELKDKPEVSVNSKKLLESKTGSKKSIHEKLSQRDQGRRSNQKIPADTSSYSIPKILSRSKKIQRSLNDLMDWVNNKNSKLETLQSIKQQEVTYIIYSSRKCKLSILLIPNQLNY